MAHDPVDLLYSDYINDRAIVEALRLPPRPANVEAKDWPDVAGFKPGDDWPREQPWQHDEVLFIRTHQAFEVWFALIIHELTAVLREAQTMFAAHGSALPRIELDSRRDDSPGYDAKQCPVLDATIQSLLKQYGPDRRSALDVIGNPARLAHPVVLPLTAALDADLNRLLPLWTSRIDRAEQALMGTVPFFDVLSTLTPGQFLMFRDRLQPASGFGSVQFRELELILGMRELNESKMRPEGGVSDAEAGKPPMPSPMLRPGPSTPGFLRGTSFYQSIPPWGWGRVAARWNAPSVRDLVYSLLNAAFGWAQQPQAPAAGTRLPDLRPATIDAFAAANVQRAVTDFHRGLARVAGGGTSPLDPASAAMLAESLRTVDRALGQREVVVAALLEMHHPDSRLSGFLNAAMRLDAALLRWRDRHIRFVESIIGMRRGTGGGGIQYLRGTTSPVRGPHYTHALPAIWQARSFVQRVS